MSSAVPINYMTSKGGSIAEPSSGSASKGGADSAVYGKASGLQHANTRHDGLKSRKRATSVGGEVVDDRPVRSPNATPMARGSLPSIDNVEPVAQVIPVASPPSKLEVARTVLTTHLDAHLPLRWPNDERQQELDKVHVDHYAPYLAARLATYGNAFPGFDGKMVLPVAEGMLSASFEGVKGMISSLMRGPIGAFVATWFSSIVYSPLRDEYELSRTGDSTTISGAVAGLSTFLTEKGPLAGMDSEAINANLPTMKSVEPAVLHPPPCKSSRLVVVEVDGIKHRQYYGPGTFESGPEMTAELRAHVPRPVTVPELQAAVVEQQKSVGWRQTFANKEAYIKPAVAAGLQVIRRVEMSEMALKIPRSVWMHSAIFGSIAGFSSKFVTESSKVTPYFGRAKVDNFAGGNVELNLFVVKGRGRDSRQPLARWSDYPKLPKAVIGVVVATPGLLLESFRHPRRIVTDFVLRHEIPNIAGAVFGAAASKSWVDSLRGRALAPDESLKSGLFNVQQLAATAVNESSYKLLQENWDMARVDPVKEAFDRKQRSLANILRRDAEASAGTRRFMNRLSQAIPRLSI